MQSQFHSFPNLIEDDNKPHEANSLIAIKKQKGREHLTQQQQQEMDFSQLCQRLRLKKSVSIDIRYQFHKMACNVFNSHDFDLMEKYFRQCCQPRPYVNTTIIRDGSGPSVGVSCQGMKYCIAYMASIFQIFPDSIFKVSNIEVFDRPLQHGSVVRAAFILNTTVTHTLMPVELTKLYIAASGHVRRDKIKSNIGDDQVQSEDQKLTVSNQAFGPLHLCENVSFPPTKPLVDWYIATHGQPPPFRNNFHVRDKLEGHFIFYLSRLNKIRAFNICLKSNYELIPSTINT